MTHSPDYYEGVRAAIAALPIHSSYGDMKIDRGWADHYLASRKALEALLPQPDPAKVLVERFWGSDDWQGTGSEVSRKDQAIMFASWLVQEGIIDPDKVK